MLKNAAHTQAPLHELTAGATKKDKRLLIWTPEAEKAFEECKQQIQNATLLAHPKEGAPLILHADASDSASGAVFQQLVGDEYVPLGFFSQKLTTAQKNYSTYDRELLAIYKAIKYFRHLVEGREFTIVTDHKPLLYAFNQRSDRASPRQLRQLDYIGQFSTRIVHLPGSANVAADALSRIQAIDMPVIVSTEDIAREQQEDDELRQLLETPSSLQLRKLRLDDSDRTIYCDISTNEVRPYIPRTLRRSIFDTVHRLAHPGARTTKNLITRRFIWPGLNKKVTNWVKTCLACQCAKIQRHNHNLPEHIRVPDTRFYQVHLDLVGPLPPSRGYQYCLTAIDRFTRWPEAIPLKDITADSIVDAFYANWIARFGAPAIITTDRGSQFESGLFQALTQLIGAHRIRTTAYHPSSNGLVERFHRSLKTAIRCHGDKEWTDTLLIVLLGLRTSVKEDVKASAAEMVYGTPIRLPGEFFIDEDPPIEPQVFIEHLRKRMRKYVLAHQRTIPALRLNIRGEQVTVSTDRLKPAYQEVLQQTPIPTTQQPVRTYTPAKEASKKVTFAT